MSGLRVLDPSGAATDWITAHLPNATVHRVSDDEAPYNVGLLLADFDNQTDPAERLAALSREIARPDGKIIVQTPEGTASRRMSVRTPGRRRAWRSIDVADLLRRFGELEEFGVDDDGYISAMMRPCTKREEIAVWTGYAIGDWNPLDIATRGLGGSETAAYRIAECLAEMGHIVTLYGQFSQEGAVRDVILRDYRRFDPTVPRRAVVCFRNAEMYDMPVNAETNILWLEDVAGAEGLTEDRLARIDHVVGVSEWHRNNILDQYPDLFCNEAQAAKVVASYNGITHSYFEGEQPDREQRVLYTSSPDRGLHIVLECWPEIKRRVPGASLAHCYGPWYDIVADIRSDAAAYRAECRRMTEEYDDVKAVGPLGQKDLAMLMRSSMVHTMPSWFMNYGPFEETCGISVFEAQAAGCYCVTRDAGALSAHNMTGAKIPGDPTTDEWREQFIDEVVRGLTDTELQAEVQESGPQAVADRTWYGVCKQLEGLWTPRRAELPADGLLTASVA